MKIAQRSRAEPLGRDSLGADGYRSHRPLSSGKTDRNWAHRSPGTGLRLRIMRYLKPAHDALPSGETMFPATAPPT
jgi:hypothetical protein